MLRHVVEEKRSNELWAFRHLGNLFFHIFFQKGTQRFFSPQVSMRCASLSLGVFFFLDWCSVLHVVSSCFLVSLFFVRERHNAGVLVLNRLKRMCRVICLVLYGVFEKLERI
jgi:hypothetical protein